MDQTTWTIQDYLEILRRRRVSMLLSAAIILAVSAVVAFVIPPAYQSTATILIESPEIPPDLVRSTVTSFADQRLELVSRRVMTSDNLFRIIDGYGLYPDRRNVLDRDKLVALMRDNINVEPVLGEARNPKTGQRTTIAFTLSFTDDTPALAHGVAEALVSLYLRENFRTRTRTATEASKFLAAEADRWKKRVVELESEIADFKDRHGPELPEQTDATLQMMERTERELIAVQNRLDSLQSTRIFLNGQLAQVAPFAAVMSKNGERVLDPDTQLAELRTEYARLSTTYAPDHPDLVRMRREIEGLAQRSRGGGGVAQLAVSKLTALRADYAATRERYSESHPDVVRLKKAVAALEKEVVAGPRDSEVVPTNPAYISLKTQLAANANEQKEARAQRDELQAKLASYEARLAQAPQVERAYRPLMREYESAVRYHEEARTKEREARVAEELEASQKGERFSVIEPPKIPEKPFKPDRLAILLVGFVMSTLGGVGTAAISEGLDDTIRTHRTILALSGQPPLATIPLAETAQEMQRRRRTLLLAIIAMLAVFTLAAWITRDQWAPMMGLVAQAHVGRDASDGSRRDLAN